MKNWVERYRFRKEWWGRCLYWLTSRGAYDEPKNWVVLIRSVSVGLLAGLLLSVVAIYLHRLLVALEAIAKTSAQ